MARLRRPALNCKGSCVAPRAWRAEELISMREIILDTETTGLNPAEGHRLVVIGWLEIVNPIAPGAVYHVLINPERDVPDDAYRIHGHSTAFLADKPAFATIAPEFLAFIGGGRLGIPKSQFEIGFFKCQL